MLHNIKHMVNYIKNKDSSIIVNDQELISSFLSNPDLPWLISFPRTGSHWLRMIMELYFEKPSLVLIFYYKDARDFTCYHRHDLELSIEGCRNVIYLYRNPVDTVYSQLSYHKEDASDVNNIHHWAELYGKQLSKWLFEETFTIKKTIITYEGMKSNMHETFAKVCRHFGTPLDCGKLDNVLKQISKKTLKKKTKHDLQVINVTTAYQESRRAFRERFSSMIYDVVCAQNEGLRSLWYK